LGRACEIGADERFVAPLTGEAFSVKRMFTLGSATDQKIVVIEFNGLRLGVTQKKADGSSKRSEKELTSEAAVKTECERMVRELLSRGFVEQTASNSTKPKPAKPAAAVKPELAGLQALLSEDDAPPAPEEAVVLPRLATTPTAASAAESKSAPKKKKKAGGKNKKKAESGDLDKRVLAGIGAVGAVCLALVGFFVYDAFLKPPTIVGTWAGSMIEYEIGKPIIHTQYRLVLDENHRASITLQEKFTSVGTYTVKGDRLKLNLKDEKDEGGEEGAASAREYKISLGRATLDLSDPESGKKVVQLIRFREEPAIGKAAPPPKAPSDVALTDPDKVDKAADDRLASVELSPKDNAFKLRHPAGWEPETGSRPDNTYSWASFTKGSAKIQVFADIAGSLISGSPSGQQYEEGSELAPVHNAHVLYQKTISEEFSDYKESKPTLFKGSRLGEGRLATFTASTGGIFGSKVRGYRVTHLTNDRRVTVLCQAPEGEFAKLKPTFLAVCRSLSR
jgi:predicted flap endonuclease-1-like 5' DNA nuclease